MGLVIIVAMALYLLISIGVVAWAISHAKKKGKSVKKWGWGAALVMYMIPFWDWIPTVAVHQYYCAKDSGFWVYKTLDQWKAENPGVMLTLVGRTISTQKQEDGYIEIYHLNQRINWVIKLHEASSILPVSKREEELVDTKNNEVLARIVDFSRGGQRSTGTTKFWLVSNDCNGGEIYRVRMGKLIDEIYADTKGGNK
jgi:hypothetical protein